MRRIQPLYEALKKEVLQTAYLHVDETTIKVLDKDKKGQTHRGFYMNCKCVFMAFNYRKLIILLSLSVLLSCHHSTKNVDFQDNVRANKEKFTNLAIKSSKLKGEESFTDLFKPIDKDDVSDSLKSMEIDAFEVKFRDSLVLFIKEEFLVIYDFCKKERTIDFIKQNQNLNTVEKIDHRLFFGKMFKK